MDKHSSDSRRLRNWLISPGTLKKQWLTRIQNCSVQLSFQPNIQIDNDAEEPQRSFPEQ